MSQHLNAAAVEYWADVDKEVDAPLRKKVEESLGNAAYVDAWVDQLVQNVFDTAPDEDAPDAQPTRRIGLHSRG